MVAANLAAFLSTPPNMFAISNIEDLEGGERHPVCMLTYSTGERETLERFHPHLNVVAHSGPNGASGQDALARLRSKSSGSCAAMIVEDAIAHSWKTKPENCDLELVGPAVLSRSSGWFTNSKSVCVHQAFGVAIQNLLDKGDVHMLWRKWLPDYACTSNPVTEDAAHLDVAEMAAIFIFFAIAAALAIASAYYDKGTDIFVGPHSNTGDVSNADTMLKNASEGEDELQRLRSQNDQLNQRLSELTAVLCKLSDVPLDKINLGEPDMDSDGTSLSTFSLDTSDLAHKYDTTHDDKPVTLRLCSGS